MKNMRQMLLRCKISIFLVNGLTKNANIMDKILKKSSKFNKLKNTSIKVGNSAILILSNHR